MKKCTISADGMKIVVNLTAIDCITPKDDATGCLLHFTSGRVLIVNETLEYFTKAESKK